MISKKPTSDDVSWHNLWFLDNASLFQVESVLYQILLELKQLYANHAPQLKPCNLRRDAVGNSNAAELESESIDPVEDMYNILEGSALIPFIEVCPMITSFTTEQDMVTVIPVLLSSRRRHSENAVIKN